MRTSKVYFRFVQFFGFLLTLSIDHDLRLCSQEPADRFDLLLRGGTVIDGSGSDMVNEAMGAMRINHLATVPVRMLSTGQKKRATLARIIATRADIWLLDEPGNGLDKESLTLLDAAMAIHRVRGGIIMAASHQPLGLSDVKTIAIGEG